MTKEQQFFSAIKNIFIGVPVEGESGYINLMRIKAKYYTSEQDDVNLYRTRPLPEKEIYRSHPEGDICNEFAYLPELSVYPNSVDINELAEIPHAALGIFKNKEEIALSKR